MYNPIQTVPNEVWDIILDNCSDLDSLKTLSKVNKEINLLVLSKLEKIKTNTDKMYDSLLKIQDIQSAVDLTFFR
ncbi:MAG: hypothetical protein K0S74_1776 [Chlamydiales bacterium]|jgi:hypothetical protein|nr:hypothetical protein [Chlamydiales bacterium]